MVDRVRRASGDELEREFLRSIIDHHEVAIEKAREAADRLPHAEAATMSRDMVRKQTAEQELLRGWHGGS